MTHSFIFENGVNVFLNHTYNFLKITTEQLVLIADTIEVKETVKDATFIKAYIYIDSTSFVMTINASRDEQLRFKNWLLDAEKHWNPNRGLN